MPKNVKVRVALRGLLSLMAEGGVKEEGQIKLHQDVTLSNITYEEWMKRYDDAIVLLKTGETPLSKEMEEREQQWKKRYHEVIELLNAPKAEPKPAPKAQAKPKPAPKKKAEIKPVPEAPELPEEVKSAPKKKVVRKKK